MTRSRAALRTAILVAALGAAAGCSERSPETVTPPAKARTDGPGVGPSVQIEPYPLPPGPPHEAAIAFVDAAGADVGGTRDRFRSRKTAEQLVARLGGHEEATVAELRSRVLGPELLPASIPKVIRAIDLLRAMDSESANMLLLDLMSDARVHSSRFHGVRVAGSEALLDGPVTEETARRLMKLEDADLVAGVIYAIDSPETARALATEILGALRHEEHVIGHAAAFHLSSDRNLAETAGAGAALLEFLEGADGNPSGLHRLPGGWTRGEQSTYAITRRLAGHAGGREVLRSWGRESTSPLVREYAVVALAECGREKDQLRAVRRALQDSEHPYVRAAAAKALGVIGASGDLPLLDRMAETDAAVMSGAHGEFHPVRNSAREAASTIRRRLSEADSK